MNQLQIISSIIKRIKAEKRKGWQGSEECVVCKGILHLSYSTAGHVAGSCETENCLKWME